jgi:hypothetical protein
LQTDTDSTNVPAGYLENPISLELLDRSMNTTGKGASLYGGVANANGRYTNYGGLSLSDDDASVEQKKQSNANNSVDGGDSASVQSLSSFVRGKTKLQEQEGLISKQMWERSLREEGDL